MINLYMPYSLYAEWASKFRKKWSTLLYRVLFIVYHAQYPWYTLHCTLYNVLCTSNNSLASQLYLRWLEVHPSTYDIRFRGMLFASEKSASLPTPRARRRGSAPTRSEVKGWRTYWKRFKANLKICTPGKCSQAQYVQGFERLWKIV